MTWEKVWGPTRTVVCDGETGAVYAVPAEGSMVYRWDGTPFGWTAVGGSAVVLAAAGWAPRSALYGLDAGGSVSMLDEATGHWASIGSPPGGASALYGGPDQLIAASAVGGDLYRWDVEQATWARIGGPAKKVVVGKSSDPEFRFEVFAQSPDAAAEGKGVYQWCGGPWNRVGGPAGAVFVSGTQLFATDLSSGDLMMLSATGWKHIGGPGKQFATDHRGHVYGLSPGGQGVWRWTGTPNKWELIGYAASAIFAGWDGQLFALNPETSELWHWRGERPVEVVVPDFASVIRTEKMKNVSGDRKLFAVLWDPHRQGHPRPERHDVEAMIWGGRPSLQDWIHENSGGRAKLVDAGVFGWYDAPADKQGEHYWDNPDATSSDPAKRSPTYHADKYGDGWLSGHNEKWADAIRRAAQDTDLAVHDANGDKRLDPAELGVFLCYPQNDAAGYRRAAVGKQHPSVEPLVVDGVTIPSITEWYLGSPPHFGIAMHELAHQVLDTPDMYFKGHWPYAAAAYSLSDQARGQHISAPEKLKLGWLDYTVVTADGVYDLPDVETTNKALILMSPTRGGDEYFVLENRWRGTSYDAGGPGIGAGIPADGLAIWHVIEDPAVFNTTSPWPPTGVAGEWGRLGIRMIRANGGVMVDDVKALFGTAGTVISDVTSPAALRWLHGASGIRVKLLSGAGPTMTLKIGVSCT